MVRHVYQSSRGGKQYVPLELHSGVIGLDTPRFAKMLAWKYAQVSSESVAEDLQENHHRAISRSHVQEASYEVGGLILSLEPDIRYRTGIDKSQVGAVSVGRDGAMLRLLDGSYREAMVGTPSLVGQDREVLHTIYLADKPEYGKGGFEALMEDEIHKLKVELGHLPWVGLADGSAHNWAFLAPHTDRQIIDWWHAWQYIRGALEAVFPEPAQAKRQIDKWETRLQGSENAVLGLLKLFKKTDREWKKTAKEPPDLTKAITYLSNHHHQMNYAHYLKEGFLIGSGVTESACKTLIKCRMCGCGMKWQEDNTRLVTLLRGLVLTKGRWGQTWEYLAKSAA